MVVHSLLGILYFLITSVTLSLPKNSAVSFYVQATRLATPPCDIYTVDRSIPARLNQDVNKKSKAFLHEVCALV